MQSRQQSHKALQEPESDARLDSDSGMIASVLAYPFWVGVVLAPNMVDVSSEIYSDQNRTTSGM